MQDAHTFGLVLLVVAVTGLLAVLSNRLTERLRVPPPALFLAAAALASRLLPGLHTPPRLAVTRVVTVALIVILFDGGMHIGWARFRAAVVPITTAGVLGTFLTTAAVAGLAHGLFGLTWYVALLLGAAVAPTDPAVVFSVLGQRQLVGRSGTILEGESGANDPVGIALMTSLLAVGGIGLKALGQTTGEFLLQMTVGGLVGLVGGRSLLWFIRAVPLPDEGLYPLRTLAGSLLLFGAASVGHGSGFLAVFVAGIVIGDGRAPYKREIRRFHSALASLGEIVAFMTLGLTVQLDVLARSDVWLPGLVLAVLLAFLVRPLVIGVCLAPVQLARTERAFVLLAGLKGAVPILLGSFLLAARVPQAQRLYGIVVVIVAFSVVVQGGLVPTAVRLLRLPMHTVQPEPWSLGMRLRDEPEGVHQFRVARGSHADGHTIGDIKASSSDVWVSIVVRAGRLVPVSGSTTLQAGDDVMILADPAVRTELERAFGSPGPPAD